MEFPQDVWMRVLLHADDSSIKAFEEATEKFKAIINCRSFWIERARIQHLERVLPPLEWLMRNDERMTFNIRKMVETGKGYSSFRPYKIQLDMSVTENAQENCLELYRKANLEVQTNDRGCIPNPQIETCFAFANGPSAFVAHIDFIRIGIDPWVLDHVRPKIRITAMVNHHENREGKLNIGAQLDRTAVAYRSLRLGRIRDTDVNHPDYKVKYVHFPADKEAKWEKVEMHLEGYSSGMRHIAIALIGSQEEELTGFYGPKVANLEVQVVLPDEPCYLEADYFEREEDEWPFNAFNSPNFSLIANWRRPPPVANF
ncbi:unnamed protein product [Caenorhabditis bovis]|uniref:F-box domain-containing protein n=1 Tax=Caenorhabditis bovis TaxID=2654633 RepID=A0A8S1EH38_9PELO|nr:unnamed protein product [Caenorhabditis bovis]